MTSSLIELRSPPTVPTAPPVPARKPRSRGWYWVAAIVAVLGLTAAFVWGTIGTITALDRVDSYDRTAVPGQVTVSVTAPGDMVVYYESPADQARYAEPAATGRPEIPYNPATEATTEVRHAAATPTWQQLGVTVIGPDGAVPVRTYRSSARYDVTPGQLGRAVAKFHATTVGEYRVSAARAAEAGATLAVGDNLPRAITTATVGAAILGLVTVLLAVVPYRARSRTAG